MTDQEKIPGTIPIVEHLPNGEQSHPSLEGAPEGTVGHPDEHLEHEPIKDGGKVVAAPPGHGVQVNTNPSEEQVERMLKEGTGEGGRWMGRWFKKKREQELAKAA